MPGIYGDTIPVVESALRFHQTRGAVLAGNIANAETPGYRRHDLAFPALLDDQIHLMSKTHSQHFPSSDLSPQGYQVERGPRGTAPNQNGIDLDREIITFSRNAGRFSDQASIIARLFGITRNAIVGEP